MFLGDFNPGDVVDTMFTTIDSSGAPTQLAGSPVVRAYKDNGTTEDDSGITLSVDFDGRTGLNHLRIDTSQDGTFYAAGAEITMVLTAGTVDGVSVVGYVICQFGIENRNIRANVVQFGGSNGTFSSGRPEVNTSHWGGTAVASAVILAAANIASDAITAAKIAADAITSSKIADGALTAAKFASGAFDAVWSVATRLLTAGTNIVLAKGTGVTGFNDLSAAQVNAEADAAIETYHLDHLLAATYDPASKPGAADALLNELVENDGGVSRFTANALEQAPTGGSAPTASEIADEVETRSLIVGTNNDKTGYGLADDAITAAKFDESTAFPVKQNDAGSTAIARTGADSDTLETLSDQLDAKASQASVDDLPTNAELATALGTADDAVLAQVALVKAKTDNLPSDPADQSAVEAAIDAAETAILAAIPTAAQNAAGLLDLSNGIETGLTPRQAFRLMVAAMAGEISGGGTTTIVIRNAVADSKDRITATVDAQGNRTAITTDLS